MSSDSHVLFFYHLIKTGGTSLNHWFADCFPEDKRIHVLDKTPGCIEAMNKRLEADSKAISGIKAVYGHGAHFAVPFFPQIKHLVLTRHPIAYAISRYVFDRAVNEGRDRPDAKEAILHGEDTLDNVLENILKWGKGRSYNTCTRHMIERAQVINPSFPAQITVDEIPALLDTFDYVGVTDQLPLFCFLLAEEFNLPLEPVKKHNSSSSANLYLPLWFRDEVEKASFLDMALYRHAVQRLDQFAAKHFNSDAEAYTRYQKYQPFCGPS